MAESHEKENPDSSGGEGEETDSEIEYEMKQSRQEFYDQLRSIRQKPFDLPETVTLLDGGDGRKVYIVGTSHFSEESVKDVEFIIDKTWPDNVVLELCCNRSQILQMDEDEIRRQLLDSNLYACVQRFGVSGGVVHYLMIRISAFIMDSLGSAPGKEFRVAYKKAHNLPHCRVFLGDRPVTMTFKRALAVLNPWMKLKLFINLLQGLEPITKEQMEEMKKADLLERLMKEMAGDYPELSRVMVAERDEYLARSIWNANNPSLNDEVGSDGDGTPPWVTVAVVGIGHMAGIKNNWSRVKDISLKELNSIPPAPMSSKIFSASLKLTFIGIVFSGGFLVVRKMFYFALPYFSNR